MVMSKEEKKKAKEDKKRDKEIAKIKKQHAKVLGSAEFPENVDTFLQGLSSDDVKNIRKTYEPKNNGAGFSAKLRDGTELVSFADAEGNYATQLRGSDWINGGAVYTEHSSESAKGNSFNIRNEDGVEIYHNIQEFDKSNNSGYASLYINDGDEYTSFDTKININEDNSVNISGDYISASLDADGNVLDADVTSISMTSDKEGVYGNSVMYVISPDGDFSYTPEEVEVLKQDMKNACGLSNKSFDLYKKGVLKSVNYSTITKNEDGSMRISQEVMGENVEDYISSNVSYEDNKKLVKALNENGTYETENAKVLVDENSGMSYLSTENTVNGASSVVNGDSSKANNKTQTLSTAYTQINGLSK